MDYGRKMMHKKRKVLFLTGTRADYGKIKSLLQAIENSELFDLYIYVTGMHLLESFGGTYREVQKDKFSNIVFGNVIKTPIMSERLGLEICDFTKYVRSLNPDLLVVHGDRLEALAGATVGAFNNIKVGHIEGGELSGTIDESVRHAISKLSHYHFVANNLAAERLVRLGENPENVFIIGSPDIDIMLSDKLPTLEETKKHYDISYETYSLLIYHPVITEPEQISKDIQAVVQGAIKSKRNFIVIYPNNDLGSDEIIDTYLKELEENNRFKIYPSIRFEYFLTLLKHCDCILGNSSAGVREACVYGKPSIDVGTRQNNRYDVQHIKNICHVQADEKEILDAFDNIKKFVWKSKSWGEGNSTEAFLNIITDEKFWEKPLQKTFFT